MARQTVSEWLHHHHGFRAALNRRRKELWGSVIDRLGALVPKAIAVFEREIEQGSAQMAAAIHVLKACAIYGSPITVGSTEAEELETVERERAAARRERQLFAF